MSDKETKKTEAGEASGTSNNNNAPNNTEIHPAIKNVSVFLSLENCEKFIDKENHSARITKLREQGLSHLQETNWMYQNN
ncbi:unnamed protein product [Chironomus riparius]|uniref:Uncharacterized protein n=1 Tax=Chironomus riparius TaxID=315576 RepID=A0A9N9RSK5_9DIPT|nr:unnamed protein product [Chironomus riparius]